MRLSVACQTLQIEQERSLERLRRMPGGLTSPLSASRLLQSLRLEYPAINTIILVGLLDASAGLLDSRRYRVPLKSNGHAARAYLPSQTYSLFDCCRILFSISRLTQAQSAFKSIGARFLA